MKTPGRYAKERMPGATFVASLLLVAMPLLLVAMPGASYRSRQAPSRRGPVVQAMREQEEPPQSEVPAIRGWCFPQLVGVKRTVGRPQYQMMDVS